MTTTGTTPVAERAGTAARPPDSTPSRPDRRGSRVSARVRILGWLLFVMLLAMLAVGVSVRTILLNQVERNVTMSLEQEIEEFTEFATTARDPDDGQPFIESVNLLTLHLQREYPDDDEVFFGYTDVLVRQERQGPGDLAADSALVQAIVTSADASGSLDTTEGELRWAKQVAVPANGGQPGTFVIGYLIDRDRADVADTIRVVSGVSLLALLFTGSIAWVVAGQILAPVRLGLEHAFGAQRQFVDDASHELRTPITIVRGHLELMGTDPAERDETIRLVTDELDRMNRIVEDLLMLAKAGRPDFVRLRTVALPELTSDVDAKVRALGERRWRLEAMGEGEVEVDPQRITQAVVQLAQNAVQHTAPDDEIRIGSALHQGKVSFWVTDTGPGVPAEDVHTIFDRFSRGSTGGARAHTGGAGLGLSIVRAIAEAHHGEAKLLSPPGEGATFGIEVPAAAHRSAPWTETDAPDGSHT